MIEHTPGPWEVGSAFDNYGEIEIAIERMTHAGNLVVAVALGGLQGQDANAKLIAAAPDLLSVLQEFSGYVRNEQMSTDGAVTYSTTTINHLAFLARAAIAKAIGANK